MAWPAAGWQDIMLLLTGGILYFLAQPLCSTHAENVWPEPNYEETRKQIQNSDVLQIDWPGGFKEIKSSEDSLYQERLRRYVMAKTMCEPRLHPGLGKTSRKKTSGKQLGKSGYGLHKWCFI